MPAPSRPSPASPQPGLAPREVIAEELTRADAAALDLLSEEKEWEDNG